MTKISEVNRDQAKFDPGKEFNEPKEVTEAVGLTRAEKLTVLNNWAFDVQRRLDAADEGMTSVPDHTGKPGSTTSDTELLRSIELEVANLKGEDGSPA